MQLIYRFVAQQKIRTITRYYLGFFLVFRYDVILPKDVLERVSQDKATTCEAIMETAQFPLEIWRIGKTKVFMKESDMVGYRTVRNHW